MNRIGVRALATGLGSALGLVLALGALIGCSGNGPSAVRLDPPARRTNAAVNPNPALPGRDLTKARDGSGDLRRVHFASKALGRPDSYLIYLPPGYSRLAKAGTRFPVLYLLHGDGRHQRHGAGHLFQRGRIGRAASALTEAGRLAPMLIVIPEATDRSVVGDTEWANTSRGRFASDVIDLTRSVDRTWPTVGSRAGRAIAGLSMGGYGAVNIALRHLGLFSTVESWSGYFTQTPTGPFAGASRAALRVNSPASYVGGLRAQLAADPIHVLLYASPTDPLHVQQAPFAASLRSLGVPVETRLFGGPHNFALWADHMGLALSFAGHWLSNGGGA
ncbi:MAG: alpha/beta hydrolase [Deltaproteobacteria bacterium]